MNKHIINKKRRKLLRDSAQINEHFKMYKVGRVWLFAGLLALSFGIGFGSHQRIYADTTSTSADSSINLTNQQSTVTAKTVALQNANHSSANVSDTSASDTSSQVASINEPTTQAGSSKEVSKSDDTSSTTANSTADVTADKTTAPDSQSSLAASGIAVSGNNTKLSDSRATSSATTQTNSSSNNQTLDTASQTTNLGDVDRQDTIDQVKAKAAQAYQSTGIPQVITAKADETQSEQSATVSVSDATKIYDGKSDNPTNYSVTLSDNLTAPTGWYLTSTANQYLVSSDSGDLDFSQVSQNVGTYNITLSATGLQRLNAVAANQARNLTVSATDITAGKLTITKAPIITGSVTIAGGSKPYDNDSSTDPTSYTVTLTNGIVAPADWTVNSDGTYTLPASSSDLDVQITSQEPGSYTVSLTTAGLQKLSDANSNYEVTADKIKDGIFTIENNNQLSIGADLVAVNGNHPSSLTVSISRNDKVPSDWTINYNNTGQDSIVYNVPLSYFDTCKVDYSTAGTYAVTLSDASLTTLNSLNSAANQISQNNVQTGQIFVDSVAASAPQFSPSNFGGFVSNGNNAVFTDGSVAQLDLKLLDGSKATFNNFTEYVIVPSGLAIADSSSLNSTTTTTYEKAADPAASLQSQIKAQLDSNGVTYSDFSVTQLNNYNGRQAFELKWGSVNTSQQNDYHVAVIVDSSVKDVSTVNYGDRKTQNDAAILYVTDSYNETQGAYSVYISGYYPNIQPVATALGVTDAVTLSDSYDNSNWAGSFTIVHLPVVDTYDLTDGQGNSIADPVTVQGQTGDSYDALSALPSKVTASDGTQYVFDPSSVQATQVFKAGTQSTPVTTTQTTGVGTTYTVNYKKVIDTSNKANQIKIENQTQVWNGTKPNAYTVTVPEDYSVPSTWSKNADGTYSVLASSADLDVSTVKAVVGSYTVKLSAQGLSDLASANPNDLFDDQIASTATLTINPLSIPVNIMDTSGAAIVPQQTVRLGDDTTENGVNVSVDGYPTSQIAEVIINYDTNSAENKYGIQSETLVANKANNTVTETVNFANGEQPFSDTESVGDQAAGDYIASEFTSGNGSSIISFGSAPQITQAQANLFADYASIDVIYNQQASATVTYIDDDNNGLEVPKTSDTIGGFVGDSETYTVKVPTGYVLVSPGKTVTTTLTSDDSDNIVIHVKHDHTTTLPADFSGQTTRTITYTGAGTKDPATVTQTIDWTTDTDEVTGVTTYTPKPNAQYASVDSPTITGYSVDQSTVAASTPTVSTTKPTDKSVTVTYSALDASLTVTYVDTDDADKTVTTDTVTGKTDGTGNYTVTVPAKYELAADQASSIPYTFTAGQNNNITVKLVHQHTADFPKGFTGTTTRTITYTGAGSKDPATVAQTVDWTTDTDDVTGVTTYTPKTAQYASVDNPTITGYSVDQATVAASTPTVTTTKPTDATVTVTYTALDASLTVTYVDTDDANKTVTTDTVNGKTDGTGNYTVTVPVKYELAADQASSIPYTFTAGQNNNITVKLVHQHTTTLPADFSGQTTRTITYTGAGTKNPATVTQTIDWTTDTDDVTGVTTYTPKPNAQYASVDSPTITGYSVDQATVAASTPTVTTTKPTDATVTVTYTALDASLTVTYVDTDDANKTVTTDTVNGKTDETGSYTVTVPNDYELAASQASSIPYTFTAGQNNNITVKLVHQHTADFPKGFTGTTTRTITYTGAGTKDPETVTQTIDWTTDTDDVTGVTTYTPKTAQYASVDSPTITGYSVDQSTVAASTPTVSTTKPTDETVTVTYTALDASLTVTYVDTDESNKTVTTDTVNGKTDETGSYTVTVPKDYELAASQANSIPYTFTAGQNNNITVKLVHQHTTTLPADFSGQTTRTITYTGAGSKDPATVTQTIDWTTDTDEVTGVTTYTPIGNTATVVTPVVAGYTPNITVVPTETITTAQPNDDDQVDVIYAADPQSVLINYVDVDPSNTSGLAPVVYTDILSGSTDSTGYYVVSVPANYELAPGQTASGITYTFKASDNEPLTIQVVHEQRELPDVVVTTTDTVHYTDEAANTIAPDNEINVSWQGYVDLVNGETIYKASPTTWSTPNPKVAGYITPAMPTFTNDVIPGTDPENQVVTMTYATAPNQGNSGKTTEPATNGGTFKRIAKGKAIYAIQTIGLYKTPNFSKKTRIKVYSKDKRIKRPEFVVIGYSRSKTGVLRYYVQQYDPYTGKYIKGTKGYITANPKFVKLAYYQSLGKTKRIKVINPRGVKAYATKELKGYKKYYKKGTTLKVVRVVRHKYTTRYQLADGTYITANKKFVIMSNYAR
ncbi:mucin-binding protein [Secundilactobacillus folii]|uniref:Gram-positive cocci surface proteins LPxTG domain-containing protein n=1 Tax=Secundilactobacillus folii TaxID=2678357 RepID=A0A7X2XZP2_9LACO|nr:MBG domain-containing protein [Secundilactobacillus folii]MTV83286.1 hypothetical protein [Secundilactobacillus folii]